MVTMSGASYRRARFVPATGGHWFALADTGAYTPLYMPRFASLGISADWTGHIRHTMITPFFSALNVTGRANPTVYYVVPCTAAVQQGGVSCYNNDVFGGNTGPAHANLGLRLVF